ncbi:MAG: O-methyltransferase, partial [Candidatus Kariarchaeaceae archaeon]
MERIPILNQVITDYLMELIPERDEILQDMEKRAAEYGFPIVGPLVGQFLTQYTILIKPKRSMELGSGYGYSAIWFARASDDDCEIFCSDGDENNKNLAEKYFADSGFDNKIKFLVGDAVTKMNDLEGEFDIIYNDIDKHGYPEAFKASIPKLRKGGVLITDNTLWRGWVTHKESADNDIEGVKEYARLAFSDPRVLSMVIPIRDGVTV